MLAFNMILWNNILSKFIERQAAFMTNSYENMTRHELEARLHFFENHVEYLNKEIAKKDEQIAKLEEQNKEQKVEIDRLGELFKQALERAFGKKTKR